VLAVPPLLVIFYLIAYVLAGMALGALSGWLTSLMTKCGRQGLLKDVLLGSCGYLVGLLGCIYMPWPRNTVVEQLEGGGSVATTMNTYQHPVRVAVVVAVLLPVFHELYRFKRKRAR
jgi:uncharacterized membrane protein YeaQ/YmgE (transglycosylase-associated protein family)